MGSYGRNVEFRMVPDEDDRRGRFVLSGTADVAMGAPLKVVTPCTPDSAFSGALPATLATGPQAPKRGLSGLAIYEFIDYRGYDPEMTTYSDLDKVPHGKLFQLISGPGVKVVFRNTVDKNYLGLRNYTGRIMVAGMGATPTVAVGDFLTPGTGDDANGYWAKNATASNAWLVVTLVDAAKQEVEAEFLF